MRLNEFYNPEFDEFQKADSDKRRKPKLTLEQINKLRKVRAIKRAEDIEHKKFVSVMSVSYTHLTLPTKRIV